MNDAPADRPNRPSGDDSSGESGGDRAPQGMDPHAAVEAAEPGEHALRPGPLRRLYHWVLGWAETPWGVPALFVLSLAESSVFPVPPDPLLAALALARPRRAFLYAGVCTAGSVLGGMLGWWIGWAAWGAWQGFFFDHVPGFDREAFDAFQDLYAEWDVWLVLAAGFSPIPYKIFTIASGVAGMNLGLFTLMSAISRGARFFLVAALFWKFGPPVREFIDRRLGVLTLAFILLVVLGVAALRLL